MPDVCIYVADTPRGTQFETHSWARDVFIGAFEGRKPRAACEGVATLFNSMPDGVGTSKLVPLTMHTNGGLSRHTEPGAGAITQAGSELTIDYGDWEYEKGKVYVAPTRSADWFETMECVSITSKFNNPRTGKWDPWRVCPTFPKTREPCGASSTTDVP
jgi:hypothetical protein